MGVRLVLHGGLHALQEPGGVHALEEHGVQEEVRRDADVERELRQRRQWQPLVADPCDAVQMHKHVFLAFVAGPRGSGWIAQFEPVVFLLLEML